MRIISAFHDYYDAVQKVAQDRSLAYLRKRRHVKAKGPWPFPELGSWFFWTETCLEVAEHTIGFCGRIYPALRLSALRPGARRAGTALCFDIAQVDAFVAAHFKASELSAYRSERWSWPRSWPYRGRRRDFQRFFTEYEEKRNAHAGLFLENKCPIFVATPDGKGTRGSIVWNASLKELEFYRVVDPHTAFQEIQMFLGALAQPLKEIPEASDEDLAEAKGFDEWSFRKEPKAGRRRR